MKLFKRILSLRLCGGSSKATIALTVLVLGLTGASPSRAEPPGGTDRMNQIGLYLWVPAFEGSMTVGSETAPIDVTVTDALKDLNLGGPLAYVRTPKPWGALLTTIFFKMETEFSTLVTGRPGTQTLQFFTADAVANRRWGFNDDKVGVELLLGFRYWNMKMGLMVESDPELEGSTDWIDGLVGSRVTVQMGKNWWFLGRLDAASGGSDLTMNGEAIFQWRTSPLFSMTFGYRLMSLKYVTTSEASRFELDTDIGGPMVAFMFSF